ncbi:hypothetical protein GJ744_007211 [Endocarpon pusillum]|uniref:Autophagy-related protein n=1 Tax=Endocarpon pusillum TaxID=364733 RepID=A0A8H7ABC9_9EURO|nr:hypothetical protein GJ744_007211 [Endocarpon pusillum]
MHHLNVTLFLAALGGCWPMFGAEHKLNLSITRDSQPVGSPTYNSSAITIHTVTRSKEINTALAGFAFLFTAGTYYLLMKYTTTLSNEIVLPSKFLEDNIAAVLSLTWPEHYIDSPEEDPHPPLVLFCKQDHKKLQKPLGACDIKRGSDPGFPPGSSMVPVRAFSPVMKSLVQIAIWNSVSFWLVLIMIVNTLIYNGFISNNITNDSIIRVVLICLYAAANAGHQFWTTILLYHNFTSILLQTCWTFICKEFIILDYGLYKKHQKWFKTYFPAPDYNSMDSRSFNFQLFGMTERSDTYRLACNDDVIRVTEMGGNGLTLQAYDKRRGYYLITQDKTESKFDKFVEPLREAEIKAYEKAAEAALEKILANIAVLLAICLATALAPWTSTQKIDARNAQLGSYALLLSISTGLLALVGSMSQVTDAAYSARTLLLFQEKTILSSTHDDELISKNFSLRDEPGFGFSQGIAGQSQLTSYSLWWSTSLLGKLPCLLFGPALMLIPRFHRNCETSRGGWGALRFTVQNVTFAWENRWGDGVLGGVAAIKA